jgi:hypothetical protein
MMRFACILIILTSAALASAQPALTAAQYVEAGRSAFEKGHYADAYSEYRAAFALESTPENALRMLIAAGYAVDLSAASNTLDVWLLKKREDARRLGDTEGSWKMVDSVTKALRFGVTQQEKQIRALQQQVADLERRNEQLQIQVTSSQTTVQSIQAGYEKQLKELKVHYEDQIDKLRDVMKSGAGTSIAPMQR